MMGLRAGAAMTEFTEPYSEQYLEGRRCGRTGAQRNTNPYFARTESNESTEVWRSKYDIWRQGWIEGHAIFERDGPAKADNLTT
jgi:hypothetical protein